MKMVGAMLMMLISGFAMAANDTYSFTYQAALRDEHGFVISNGTTIVRNQTIALRLWDAPMGGNLLWGRTYNVYTDETGLFNLEVSDSVGSKVDDAPEGATLESVFSKNPAGGIYIGLFVSGSSGEIVPRQRIFAVPFAAVANDVRQISGDITVGGRIKMGTGVQITKDGISQSSGGSTFQNLTVNGDVGVSGKVTVGGGLVVNGGTVTIKPAVTLSDKLTVDKAATFKGGVSISGGDLTVAAGKKVTVGESDLLPVPVGGIILWTKKELPDTTHWAICNGENNTPDLRGRFVVGANNGVTGVNSKFSTYNPDLENARTGGEERHALSQTEMPSHYHLHFGDDHLDYKARVEYRQSGYDADSDDSGNSGWFRTSSTGGDPNNNNNTVPHENRPPYYALYYIMRIK